ncbi:MAG TPA: Asp-tRNA(Asn)/Glu-tRNA(Gln) amidotransferase subunit GatC [Gemmatimonadaceae bacterium]|nr:Asp-tRNA(Asn)/Glu-tRNA(Gln) amidotransferase subunit GatC [Gemmatimonadaceae bacterium]
MAVKRDDVAHVAALARLALDEAQMTLMVTELNGILAHMDVLQQVDTAGDSGTAALEQAGMPLRRDAGPPLSLARPLESFAPSMRDGFLLVPRLATHEDAAPEDLE